MRKIGNGIGSFLIKNLSKSSEQLPFAFFMSGIFAIPICNLFYLFLILEGYVEHIRVQVGS
jgi:hypothetical protein